MSVPDTSAPIAKSPQAQSEDKASAGSTASISGDVRDSNGGRTIAGVTVTALLFDDNGGVKFSSSAVSESDGTFSIAGLAPANYWVLFTDTTKGGQPVVNWWESTFTNPSGNQVTVTDGQAQLITWMMVPSAKVVGNITCEGCTAPPPVATTGVFAAIPDTTKPGYWKPIAQADTLDADGSYSLDGLYPNTGDNPPYEMFAVNEGGSSNYASASDSTSFVVGAASQATINVIMRRLIAPVAGVEPQINSVVNALYWDFLGRLPGPTEVSFWRAQFARGLPLGAVSTGFVTSDEYRLIRINAAYQTILGRGADPAGRLDWLHWMQQGRITTDDIETSFYASQEYFNNNGGNNTSFMKAIYETLLHREGTSADYAFWSNLVNQHGRDWVVAQFWDSTETISERVSLMYEHYLGRTPDPNGLAGWVSIALQIGDSGLRAGLSGSDEYFGRSQYRFSEQ
ncbi:hypothetical protein GCM10011399_22280 [Subtercola lobariae]|uniref:alpha-amylase n=2 Tax=Subtercola lobariae TaxID=1588641 RepID=A0A917BAS8_9MICO|nr:hypothetical protein GCM10011399_22280 [Subtercola lobariae]